MKPPCRMSEAASPSESICASRPAVQDSTVASVMRRSFASVMTRATWSLITVLMLHLTCRNRKSLHMAARLGTSFFDRPADEVARDLLGKALVRRLDGRRVALTVSETEAYLG